MTVRRTSESAWLLLTFTLPTKRASQRVEIWRKLQRYGTVPLGIPATYFRTTQAMRSGFSGSRRRSGVRRRSIGGSCGLHRQSVEAAADRPFRRSACAEYQELIRELHAFSSTRVEGKGRAALSRLRNRFQEIVEVDFFDSPLQKRVQELLEQATRSNAAKSGAQPPRSNRKVQGAGFG